MTSITITNKDDVSHTFTLSYNAVTGEEAITDMRGFTQDYSVKMNIEQGARQQGGTTVGVVGQRRNVSFTVHLFKKSREKLLQRVADIVEFLNPHYGEVTIQHTSDYRTREIVGYLRKYEFNDTTNTGGYGILALTFECDEPFFKDTSDNQTYLGTGDDVFIIPDSTNPDDTGTPLTERIAFYFGPSLSGYVGEDNVYTEFGLNVQEIVVNNTGQYLAPVFVTINGPVENPELERTALVNGLNYTDTLKFTLNSDTIECEANDYIEVDTAYGRETAKLFKRSNNIVYNGYDEALTYKRENESSTKHYEIVDNGDGTWTLYEYTVYSINKYLDPDSNYWKLNLGENTIRLVSNGGTPRYTFSYRQRYISA